MTLAVDIFIYILLHFSKYFPLYSDFEDFLSNQSNDTIMLVVVHILKKSIKIFDINKKMIKWNIIGSLYKRLKNEKSITLTNVTEKFVLQMIKICNKTDNNNNKFLIILEDICDYIIPHLSKIFLNINNDEIKSFILNYSSSKIAKELVCHKDFNGVIIFTIKNNNITYNRYYIKDLNGQIKMIIEKKI